MIWRCILTVTITIVTVRDCYYSGVTKLSKGHEKDALPN
jgi:hypothetical protein